MTDEIQSEIISARNQLQDTLDEIGNRLNVPKRARKSYRENPTAWKVGVTLVGLGIAGVITWAVMNRD